MTRTLLALAAALSLSALALPVAHAADAATPADTAASAVAKKKRNASHQALKSEAKAKAVATETVEQMTAGQLDAAHRVLDGVADCEFNQKVTVERGAQDGQFKVSFNKVTYAMVPEETSTGAIRLVDKKAGVVWLQIPIKSMLLNERAGKRMVDLCMQAEQKAATAAMNAAAPAAAASASK